ncbi:Metallo-dependent phosphatase-like protein [Epithele typhae]|uniref:Metallo-dependent phosphatase-like protein n=1 Tax=Epithele typhae TaxID=378194 RepID=UPI002008DAB3|nr:Metallo-dependent phosphatase-like protein [Epithele typhae]KAH9946301.1 Metallo-dependent phosphatase-like protein [Epithele typhae]
MRIINGLWTLALMSAVASAVTVGDVMRSSLRAYAKRSTVSEILTDIEDLAECSACEALLVVLKALAHLGNSDFVSVITTVCEDLGVEDSDVCAGAIGLEGPILAHDLRQMTVGTKTSQLFCLTVFGLCQWPDVDTSYSPSMSAKPAKSRPLSSGKTPIKVVHISDIHVDLSYEAGASFNCTKNICCRPYTTADAPGNNAYPAGAYGNPSCDTPVTLEESMYSAIETLVPDRSFMIFTGDVVEGAVWLVTDEEVTNDLNDAYSRMKSVGKTYAVTGNHDASPVNSFPSANIDTTITTQWAYDALSSDWETWIGPDAAAQVSSNFGSYSVVDSNGLRIISVNTNFWYKQNFWMYEKDLEHDPSGMFAWLVSELEAAETAGQRVWILGHMPMGASDAFHDASYYFDLIIQRFDATIAAVFYGHTHKDEFEIAYSDYSNQAASTATMMSYIAPALTPTSGNPTFRVYDVDPVTFGILDFTVYYADLDSATFQEGPTWQELYSVKATYGALLGVTDPAAELTPAVWHNLTELFESDDTVFQQYYARKTRDFSTATCTGTCKTDEICQLRAAQSQFNCGTIKPGVNFKRDTTDATPTTAGECDGSQAVPILSAIPGSTGLQALQNVLVAALGSGFMNTTIPSNYTVNGTTYGK